MVTEKRVIGKIEILEDGQIQIREDNVIERDGKEIHREYHRRVLEPGKQMTNEVEKLQNITAVVWTPQVVAEFQTKRQAQIGNAFGAQKENL